MKNRLLLAPFIVCSLLLPTQAEPGPKADDIKYIKKAALDIDKQVAAWYKKKQLPVPEVTDDATFVRRAFLVTVGRIPTSEETRAFLEMTDENKRYHLIDYLLESPGHSSHMTNWAFDLLRVVDRSRGIPAAFEQYREWIRKSMEDNMPWDDFTAQILTAEGNIWDPNTASVGYYLRDRGMPLDNIANSMRIFLGSRMECAQCHDDPFGDRERREFYELAAFTNGQQQANRKPMVKLWREVREEDRRQTPDFFAAQVFWDQIYGMTLQGGGAGRIKLPDDYQYRDGDPGEMVGARTPTGMGKMVRMSERKHAGDGRHELAEWVTTKTGEQFPSVISNRMWERIMGRGFYEPYDEYVPAKDTHIPALMNHLVDTMVEVDYDLRTFQKILLYTKTFQFAPNPKTSVEVSGDDLHGRQLSRMSAEQIWDSILTLIAGNPDSKLRFTADNKIRVRGVPVEFDGKTMKELSDEVLKINDEKELRNYYARFLASVKEGGVSSDRKSMMMMQRSDNKRRGMLRASDLPSPAPRNHMLYLFGQSDREVVEGASREPNVSQVLTLMNGIVQNQLVYNKNAMIYRDLEGVDSNHEKIRRLYLAILNRPPSQEEMKWMLEEVEVSGKDAFPNIVSALVMSSEFLFIQ